MMAKMIQSNSSSSGSNSKSAAIVATAAATKQLIQVASLLAVVLLLIAQLPAKVECQEQLSIESRQQKDNDDLTDTIKYLEKLDKYFSQIARPRFGRSDYKQPHRLQPSWSRFSSMRADDSVSPLNNFATSGNNYNSAADLLDLARTSRLNYK